MLSNYRKISVGTDSRSDQRPHVQEGSGPRKSNPHPKAKIVGNELIGCETRWGPVCDQHSYVHWSQAHVEVPSRPTPTLTVQLQIRILWLHQLVLKRFHFFCWVSWISFWYCSATDCLIQVDVCCDFDLAWATHNGTIHGKDEEQSRDNDVRSKGSRSHSSLT